ncbi:plasmid maintenance protein CcdB [Niveispirillum sp. SYP-B3756]|uniref:CcdB family protein n=1 Tax=Niveispirillum sp. SYP-B3756 TaxID=2662178 RepID=UPI00129209F9|nr:CcdB family protein [Niveispirillum sp. SYP-B3756]MQP64074.1 plasmid maintenance protein CcdB [Niveispirillum sp. SYP-B3756]
MARFDVYPLGSGTGYVLDVQANLLRDLNTRMVVPLVARSQAPKPISRLNPIFRVMGEDFVMMTQQQTMARFQVGCQ